MVAICQMIASGHGLRAFIENSGLDAVVSAMNMHSSISQMQLRGCAALCQVAVGDGDFKNAILRSGGVQALVQALRTHLCALPRRPTLEPAALDLLCCARLLRPAVRDAKPAVGPKQSRSTSVRRSNLSRRATRPPVRALQAQHRGARARLLGALQHGVGRRALQAADRGK